MNEAQKIMHNARILAEENIVVGARELVELSQTCILQDGVIREIAQIVSQLNIDNPVTLAQAMMRDAIVNWAANQEIK